MAEEKPKIIVDDDWKKQAQAEKEQLDQQTKNAPKPAKAPAETAAPGGAKPGAPRELPPADFATLVSSLASQIMMSLGGVQDPQTGRRHLDLSAAKFHIDMLTMLEEKTRGNLTDDEKKLFDETIYRVRMLYVEVAQQAAEL